jgi:hypothetical protein
VRPETLTSTRIGWAIGLRLMTEIYKSFQAYQAGSDWMPASPLDELAASLRRLHREAGEPSTHEIGKGISYSHTTVAQALKGAKCPSWPVVKALVTYLDGDIEIFRMHWVAVRDAEDPLPESAATAADGGGQAAVPVASDMVRSGSEVDPAGNAGEHVVLRWKTRLETVEFFDEGLALQWIKARMQIGDSDE